MVKIKTTLKAVLASALAMGMIAFSAHAADTSVPVVFKATHGVSLEVGSKKVAGYYIGRDGACDVTLMVADLPNADGHVSANVTRINMPVKAGGNARVYTEEGRVLELSCSLATSVMTLRTLDQTAFVAKR